MLYTLVKICKMIAQDTWKDLDKPLVEFLGNDVEHFKARYLSLLFLLGTFYYSDYKLKNRPYQVGLEDPSDMNMAVKQLSLEKEQTGLQETIIPAYYIYSKIKAGEELELMDLNQLFVGLDEKRHSFYEIDGYMHLLTPCLINNIILLPAKIKEAAVELKKEQYAKYARYAWYYNLSTIDYFDSGAPERYSSEEIFMKHPDIHPLTIFERVVEETKEWLRNNNYCEDLFVEVIGYSGFWAALKQAIAEGDINPYENVIEFISSQLIRKLSQMEINLLWLWACDGFDWVQEPENSDLIRDITQRIYGEVCAEAEEERYNDINREAHREDKNSEELEDKESD